MIRMAIADSNKEYLDRISDVMEEYADIALSKYTERHSLEAALSTKSFDVLLFDPGIYDGQVSVGRNMLAVMLLDEDCPVPDTCLDFKKIRKYQRISNIYKQILELYADICKDVGNVVGRPAVISIAFYSPVGGSGKTTMALATAARLAMQGHNTFYINFEDIASEDCYLPQSAEKGVSELVSLLGSGINFPMKLQSLLQNKGEHLYYLNHFDSPNDVYEMTGQEIVELLTEIVRAGLFEYIIVDMGIGLDAKMLCIFEQMQKIVLVEKPDAIAVHKMKTFMAQAHIINEYGRKMVRILNFDNGRAESLASELPLIGRVGAMSNPDSAQLITMLAGSSGLNYTEALKA